MSTERELTFGEKSVGLTFNPSGDARVDRAKQLCAELANLVVDDMHPSATGNSDLKRILCDNAIGAILAAQMISVKVLTLKY